MKIPRINQEKNIYVVKCNEFYKIGIAYKLLARLGTMQSGNPYRIKLIYTKRVASPYVIEKALHWMFAAKRTHGEWFELDLNDIKRIKEYVETQRD